MTNILIPIERLTSETLIRVGKNDAARVIDIRFDGSGYGIDLRYGQSDEGYEEYLYVDAGGSVEFVGVGQPVLRSEQYVTKDERQAKGDALEADIDRMRGCVARNVDDLLLNTVAEAVGVPTLLAAE